MTNSISPRKRGRPKRHPVDVLRTKLWFHVLKLISGLPSAYALEFELEPQAIRRTRKGDILRPRKWDLYESGERVPQKMKGKRYMVVEAEARFPGAAMYFDSPMWAVLRKDSVTKAWVESELRRMTPPVAEILLSDELIQGESERRFREFDQQSAERLAAIGTFDALAATVLLIAKSELIASPELRSLALDAYLSLLPILRRCRELAPFMEEISLVIDTTCKHWLFVNTQSRMDIVFFSSEIFKSTNG